MAEAVVDLLEMIEIEKEYGHNLGIAPDAGKGLLQPLVQQRPIGQPS